MIELVLVLFLFLVNDLELTLEKLLLFHQFGRLLA